MTAAADRPTQAEIEALIAELDARGVELEHPCFMPLPNLCSTAADAIRRLAAPAAPPPSAETVALACLWSERCYACGTVLSEQVDATCKAFGAVVHLTNAAPKVAPPTAPSGDDRKSKPAEHDPHQPTTKGPTEPS